MAAEGQKYAEAINSELGAILDGSLWYNDLTKETVQADHDEMVAKYGRYYEDSFEQMGFWDWFQNNVYDHRFVIEADKSYRSSMLMTAGGGPSTWINTETGKVEFYWGTERQTFPLSYEVRELIDENMEMLYEE